MVALFSVLLYYGSIETRIDNFRESFHRNRSSVEDIVKSPALLIRGPMAMAIMAMATEF